MGDKSIAKLVNEMDAKLLGMALIYAQSRLMAAAELTSCSFAVLINHNLLDN